MFWWFRLLRTVPVVGVVDSEATTLLLPGTGTPLSEVSVEPLVEPGHAGAVGSRGSQQDSDAGECSALWLSDGPTSCREALWWMRRCGKDVLEGRCPIRVSLDLLRASERSSVGQQRAELVMGGAAREGCLCRDAGSGQGLPQLEDSADLNCGGEKGVQKKP